jgi:DHA2 family methylenomycin A resistance protein-like MFS transporter
LVSTAAAALVLGIGFSAVERRRSQPMIPHGLFSRPAVASANAVGFLASFPWAGFAFVITFWFQHSRGYSPFATGIAYFPLALASIGGSVVGGRLVSRGARVPAIAGAGFACVGMAILSGVGPHAAAIDVALILSGLSVLLGPAMNVTVMESVESSHLGAASGTLNSSRQIGSLVAIAVLGAAGAPGNLRIGATICLIVSILVLVNAWCWFPRRPTVQSDLASEADGVANVSRLPSLNPRLRRAHPGAVEP